MMEEVRPTTLKWFDICYAAFVTLLLGNFVRRWHSAIEMQKDGTVLDTYTNITTVVALAIALGVLGLAWTFTSRKQSRVASSAIITLMVYLSYAGIVNFIHDNYTYGWLFLSALMQIALQIGIIILLLSPAALRWHWKRPDNSKTVGDIFS